jgi:hypothetical protein
MRREHRRWHLVLWLAIGPLAAAILAAGVVFRRPLPVETQVIVEPPRPPVSRPAPEPDEEDE